MAEKAEMAEKSGKSGRNFYAVLVVITLLHHFIRVGSLFPVPAIFQRVSISTDSCRLAGAAGLGASLDGSGRVKSGQSGKSSCFWTLVPGVSHVSLPSLPGWRQTH